MVSNHVSNNTMTCYLKLRMVEIEVLADPIEKLHQREAHLIEAVLLARSPY